MKKLVLGIMLIFSLNANDEFDFSNESDLSALSGTFFGGHIGYSSRDVTIFENNNITMKTMLVGVVFGYQNAFNDYSGIRLYGSLDISPGGSVLYHKYSEGTYRMKSLLGILSGNADIYVGYKSRNGNYFGVFGGIGLGYMTSNGDSKYYKFREVALLTQAGFFDVINGKHRFELVARITPLLMMGKASNENIVGNVDGFLRYSYLF